MAWTLRLFGRSVEFCIRNAWPLLVALILFAPADFALSQYHDFLFRNLKGFPGPMFLIVPVSVLFINLVYALFQAVLYALVWSRLHAMPLTYKSFRDWLLLSFWNFYLYFLIYYLVMVAGGLLLIIPILLFFLLFPYLDLAILFDHKRLGEAARLNLALIAPLPVPIIVLSLFRFLLFGLAPVALLLAGGKDVYQTAYSLAVPFLSLPVDVSVVVLYSYLTRHKVPRYYAELDFDEPAQHADWF